MTPSTAFVVLSAAALLLAVGWGCWTILRSDGGAALTGDDAVDAEATSTARWSGRARVICPRCDAENYVSTVYCIRCRTQLSPEWLTEW